MPGRRLLLAAVLASTGCTPAPTVQLDGILSLTVDGHPFVYTRSWRCKLERVISPADDSLTRQLLRPTGPAVEAAAVFRLDDDKMLVVEEFSGCGPPAQGPAGNMAIYIFDRWDHPSHGIKISLPYDPQQWSAAVSNPDFRVEVHQLNLFVDHRAPLAKHTHESSAAHLLHANTVAMGYAFVGAFMLASDQNCIVRGYAPFRDGAFQLAETATPSPCEPAPVKREMATLSTTTQPAVPIMPIPYQPSLKYWQVVHELPLSFQGKAIGNPSERGAGGVVLMRPKPDIAEARHAASAQPTFWFSSQCGLATKRAHCPDPAR